MSKNYYYYVFRGNQYHDRAINLQSSDRIGAGLEYLNAATNYKKANELKSDSHIRSLIDLCVNRAKALRQTRRIVVSQGASKSEYSEIKEWPIEYPTTTLDEVIGLSEAKDYVEKNIIIPYKHPDLVKKYVAKGLESGASLLLYGPPGTGKTYLAQAIAGEIGAPLVMPNGLMSSLVGESEKNIRSVFKQAKTLAEEQGVSVLFFDEIDQYLSEKNDSSGHDTRVVRTFLTELDGVGELGNVLVLGATNVPSVLEAPSVRRFQFAYAGLPDLSARRGLFQKHIKKMQPVEMNYSLLVKNTDRYSGADIKKICQNVLANQLREDVVRGAVQPINTQVVLEEIPKVNPISKVRLAQYKKNWELFEKNEVVEPPILHPIE